MNQSAELTLNHHASCLLRSGGARNGVLMRVSRRLISFSSLSIPGEPCKSEDGGMPRAPCLSNRYVSKFFLSSASPSKRVNRCVSSRSTSCAAMIQVAADSRIIRDVLSFSAYETCKSLHCSATSPTDHYQGLP